MSITKVIRNTAFVAAFVAASAVYSGCGGVDEAQMAELNNLRNQVSSLEQQANSLREERTRLERDVAERNAKLQQCAKDKEETRANLDKLPK